jgi:hypothetical protein
MAWAADIGVTLDHGAEVPPGVQFAWSVRAATSRSAGRRSPGRSRSAATAGETDEPQQAALPAPAPARTTRRATAPRPQPT